MKGLFLHNNFPGHFLNIMLFLARDERNETVFISRFGRNDIKLPSVKCVVTKQPGEIANKYSNQRALLEGVQMAELFAYEMLELKKQGFYPDFVCDHPGWGCGLYVPEIFPDAARVCLFEWFYTKNILHNFLSKGNDRNSEGFAQHRQRNLYQLDALMECDVAITPTFWQFSQYPPEFFYKFCILHDGIDTDFFVPAKHASTAVTGDDFVVEHLNLGSMDEIVTYTARGMEPFRGFPQFFRSIPKILQARPRCHVVIMANDSVNYSPPRADGKTWGQAMREEVAVDSSRVHFLSFGAYHDYLRVLQASSVHLYLTAPFVLSWSLLEAMSCSCLLVASDTDPVREIVRHGENGFLTDFWSEEAIADAVITSLENRHKLEGVRHNARHTVVERYDAKKLAPQKFFVIQQAIAKRWSLSQAKRDAAPHKSEADHAV